MAITVYDKHAPWLDVDEISYYPANYSEMRRRWRKVDDLLGGTDRMRKCGETYTPKFDGESQKAYNFRLSSAVITNFYKQTGLSLLGKIFQSPLYVEDEFFLEQGLSHNIDGRGTSLQVFARNCMWTLINYGISDIFVDMSDVKNGDPTRSLTLAEERALKLRPVWIHYKPENIHAAYTADDVNGVETYQHIRIYEEYSRFNGRSEEKVEQYRVFHRADLIDDDEELESPYVVDGQDVSYQVWRKVSRGPAGMPKEGFQLDSSGGLTLSVIPMTTMYAMREDVRLSKLPLEDIAYKQIEHFNSHADQKAILHMQRAPLLFSAGFSANEGVDFTGPHTFIKTANPEAKLAFVEPSGYGERAGQDDLSRIVQEAHMQGLNLLTKQPGNETATGRLIDRVENTSPLQDLAYHLEWSLNEALQYTHMWYGRDPDDVGRIRVNKEFGINLDDHTSLLLVMEAYKEGAITAETMLKTYKKAGIFPEDISLGELIRTMPEKMDEESKRDLNLQPKEENEENQ